MRDFGKIHEKNLQSLKNSVTVHNIQYGPIYARVEKRGKSNSWLEVQLAEGKNREVRKALASIGLTVNRLIRTQYGPFQLGNLKRGELLELTGLSRQQKLGEIYALPS